MRITLEARSLLIIWTYSNPPLTEGAVIDGYRVYINGTLNRTTSQTQLNITGLTPFTSYTVEVSAYNRRDGVEQEGPRSDPVTNMTLEDGLYYPITNSCLMNLCIYIPFL